jgi:putative ABC transport system ATP-binding protein
MTPGREDVLTVATRQPGPSVPVLSVRSVEKTYRRGSEDVHALRGASLELRAGELVALVGRSGSGKTTLLSILCGWEHADAGEIQWLTGDGSASVGERPWDQLAMVPQRLGLVEELSVRENVAMPVRFGRRKAGDAEHAEEVQRLLDALGLSALADRWPAETSIGEQQRTALARALVLRPTLLLADEPTGHQDEGWAKGVLALLHEVAESGTCCLVATHNEEIVRFADRVLQIRDGVVAQA